MREILYRGKRIDNGEWAEGYYVKTVDYRTDSAVHLIIELPSAFYPRGEIAREYEINSSTIGQYTGLTDKNGKKVFEGDIVRYNDTIHKVIFCTITGCAFFGITMPERGEIWNFDGITCANKMEVIGNIHDNPELLEATK